MSKSYKHTPISGWTTGDGQKNFRTSENKAKRRRVHQLLQTEQYEDMPDEKEYGNEWASPRDGKMYFGHWQPDDPKDYQKSMRK